MLAALSNVSGLVVYLVVGALVFAEDAIFVGFLIPGETAAILGGVAASRGHVHLALIAVIVVVAAIVGDTVGYEVGKHVVGPRLLGMRRLDKHRHRIDKAQSFLARRGGMAVFLGRFTAFFRAVMPALAGAARMPYPRFVAYNAAGGLLWGTGFVLLGYLAGSSYAVIAQQVGTGTAIALAVIVVGGLLIWQLRRRQSERRAEPVP